MANPSITGKGSKVHKCCDEAKAPHQQVIDVSAKDKLRLQCLYLVPRAAKADRRQPKASMETATVTSLMRRR